MDINTAFGSSKYLSEKDLNGRAITVTMSVVHMEVVDEEKHEEKPIVYFEGAKKALALNKTNAATISEFYGTETDQWRGQKIELYPTMTDFKGTRTPCIRVRIPAGVAPPAVQAAAAAQAPLPPAAPAQSEDPGSFQKARDVVPNNTSGGDFSDDVSDIPF